MRLIRVVEGPFDPGEEIERFARALDDVGALASFVGKVRGGGAVCQLELSHYAPLTQKGMEALADEAFERFDLRGLLMVHRVGAMKPGEPIVAVSAGARHRRGALLAIDFCMDHLKSDAWFWKRELRGEQWHWIEPRPEDHADRLRWAEKS
ncbi:MAG: molybdenum cofactor biosynthesis protein MoaE [Novosphingobium sp.]|nr:molybdenum cofactor biosynthesis protein MoaE [Novosphingobium sp.]MCP5378932.1 molybdenum cofactor biosynthesis protein MoaE [Novosphingobium sp.]